MVSREAIFKTLLYSDIFNYPLKKEEIWKFLISDKKLTKKFLFEKLQENIFIESEDNFYFLKGRRKIIEYRKKNEEESFKKIQKTINIIKILSLIPTVNFIGISGSLALNNSSKNDDIDFFVITSSKTVWSTRFFMIVILLFLGKYRRKNSKKVRDKICLNMLIEETEMEFKKEKQDLFIAHEIAQVLPLFSRDKAYEKFLFSNQWIKDFLPNIFSHPIKPWFFIKQTKIGKVIKMIIQTTEPSLKFLQFWYMKKSITREVISDNFIAFHPKDYRHLVLKKYYQRLKNHPAS